MGLGELPVFGGTFMRWRKGVLLWFFLKGTTPKLSVFEKLWFKLLEFRYFENGIFCMLPDGESHLLSTLY